MQLDKLQQDHMIQSENEQKIKRMPNYKKRLEISGTLFWINNFESLIRKS